MKPFAAAYVPKHAPGDALHLKATAVLTYVAAPSWARSSTYMHNAPPDERSLPAAIGAVASGADRQAAEQVCSHVCYLFNNAHIQWVLDLLPKPAPV